MSKKLQILIIAESVVIVALAVALFFAVSKSNRAKSKFAGHNNHKAMKSGKPGKGSHKGGGGATSLPPAPVEAIRGFRKSMEVFLTSNCNIEAEKSIDVFSKTSGEVKLISVEEGRPVIADDLLAQLDQQEAELALKEAGIKLENAKLVYERSNNNYENNIMSKEEFETARLNYQMAEVAFEKSRLELDYYTIKSPLEGAVVERHIEVGDNVNAGQKLFTIAKFDRTFAKIYAPEKELARIRPGQTARVSVESIPDMQFEGKVTLINPVIESKSGTVKVTIEITDPNKEKLRPGMFASVFIVVEERANALVIPKKALIKDSITDEVFIIKNLARLTLPKDSAGMVSNGDTVEIKIPENAKKSEALTGVVTNVTPASNSGQASEPAEAVVELTNAPANSIEESIAKIELTNQTGEKYLRLDNIELKIETVAHKKEIKPGFSKGDEVEAVSGITDNDMVITAGHEDLVQGAKVIVLSD